MRPEILLIEPMIAPIEASLDANYRVHRLFEAQDQPAFINAGRFEALPLSGYSRHYYARGADGGRC